MQGPLVDRFPRACSNPVMEMHLPNAAGAVMRLPFAKPAFLTLKSAGSMKRDGEVRASFLQEHRLDAALICVPGQIHSRTVAVADGPAPQATKLGEQFYPDTDGLMTSVPEHVLTVTVADCMPIFVLDTRTGARALLHSGWKGTGILETAVLRMKSVYGSVPGELFVLLGPCISAEAYAVDADRARTFRAEWGDGAVRESNGREYLDLQAANQEICRRLGITQTATVSGCTVMNTAFGSYRREGAEAYTLMMAIFCGDEWELK